MTDEIMQVETKKYPAWSKIWFSWLSLSALYFVLIFIGPAIFRSVIGLFVPVGLISAMGLLTALFKPSVLTTLPDLILILVAYFCLFNLDKHLEKYINSVFIKIIINLLLLFLLTFLFDFSIWHTWKSFDILQNSGIISLGY